MKSIDPVSWIVRSIPVSNTSPPPKWTRMYLCAASLDLLLFRASIRKVEDIAISSQKRYQLIISPANTTPNALPTYTNAAVFWSLQRSLHEKISAPKALRVNIYPKDLVLSFFLKSIRFVYALNQLSTTKCALDMIA